MSYSLNSLKGGYIGTTIGAVKGDTGSLDCIVHRMNAPKTLPYGGVHSYKGINVRWGASRGRCFNLKTLDNRFHFLFPYRQYNPNITPLLILLGHVSPKP